MTSKTFCLYPFTHVEINNNGAMTPCCRFQGSYKIDGREANIVTDDFENVVNSKHAQEIRQALMQGERYPACDRCWRDEDIGLASQRQRYLQNMLQYNVSFNDPAEYKIISLDLKLGNTCNQMCIICNGNASSMIASEEKDSKIIPISSNKGHLDWYRKNMSMEKIYQHIQNVKHIELYGGEPWLIKQQWDFLARLIEDGLSKDVTLNYATNGSIFKHEYFSEIFSQFKRVSILYSADGIQDTFEYCRYPGKWDNFESNLKESFQYMNDNITCRIGYTVSVYSIFNVIESLEYYSKLTNDKNKLKVWFNLVNDPRSSIRNLPKKLKKELKKQIRYNWKEEFPTSDVYANEALIQELDAAADESGWLSFIKHTKEKDRLRNLDIIKVIPQLKSYMSKY